MILKFCNKRANKLSIVCNYNVHRGKGCKQAPWNAQESKQNRHPAKQKYNHGPLSPKTIPTWNYIFQPFIFRRLWDFRLSTSCCCFSLAAPLRVNLLVPSFWCGCDRPASSVSKMCHFWSFLGVTFKSVKGGKGNHISQTNTLDNKTTYIPCPTLAKKTYFSASHSNNSTQQHAT